RQGCVSPGVAPPGSGCTTPGVQPLGLDLFPPCPTPPRRVTMRWPFTSATGDAMTHHDAFLQAILEEPDDDGMRLIFADWRGERAAPRGEFTRAQCQLARLPPGDPRRRRLHVRAAELFRCHANEWVGPLRPFLLRCGFRRGFVERATVRGRAFVRAPD